MNSYDKNTTKRIHNIKYRFIFIFFLIAIFIISLLFQFGSFMLSADEPPIQLPNFSKMRGAITDRNGQLLALQTKLYNLSATKTLVTDKELCAKVIAPLIGSSEEDILQKLTSDGSNFLYLKKKLTESQKAIITEAIKQNNLKGIRLEEVINRTYPENKLASTLIGFLGDDGYGLSGIEYSAQNILSPPEHTEGYDGKGYNVFLSIDNHIQYLMQKASETAMETWQSESLIFIAADAKSGEILGYVSEPSPDLAFFTQSSPEQLLDRPANYIYEPGSVFKIFSVAALMDLNEDIEHEQYYCDGSFSFPHSNLPAITCQTPHGTVTAEGIIQHSCNVGVSYMSETSSNQAFYEKLREFGFGQKTGIELPGETSGLFANPRSWSARSKPTIAMGQELGVSALQIVEAATAFANGGNRIDISLISKITDTNETVLYVHTPEVESTPISAKTAEKMLEYMATDNGIAWRASVSGVPISAKTGTAQMVLEGQKTYSKTDYVASCIALFPSDNPQIILYLAVIKPQGNIYGSVVAAPIISEIASEIVDYYGLNRDGSINIKHSGIVSTEIGKKIILGKTMPDLSGISKKELQSLFDQSLNPYQYTILIEGDGYVYEQKPAPGEPLTQGTKIELKLK